MIDLPRGNDGPGLDLCYMFGWLLISRTGRMPISTSQTPQRVPLFKIFNGSAYVRDGVLWQ